MSIIEKIRTDWIDARKGSDKVKANLLGTLIGSIQTKEKNFNPSRNLSDGEIVIEVSKMLTGIREVIRLLEINSSNTDQLSLAKLEENILSEYIPSQLSTDELKKIIDGYKKEGDDLKTIMTKLKANHAGQYDGKIASEFAKS